MSADKARTSLKNGTRIEITLTSVYENADVESIKPYVDDLDKSIQFMKECHLADLETGYTEDNKYYIKVIIYDDRKITIDEFLYIRMKIAKIKGDTKELYNCSWTYTDIKGGINRWVKKEQSQVGVLI